MISEFPLFVFTTLSGLAAGTYVLFALLPQKNQGARPWLSPLICLVLLGVSGLVLLAHLGHPERMLNAFANPSAGIAQEAYTMVAFGVLAFADAVLCFAKGFCPRWLRIAGGVCAALMMVAMGMAYFTVAGIGIWASWETISLFILGDLAMGWTLCALLFPERLRKASFAIAGLVFDALAVASLAAEAVRFDALGFDAMPFVGGIALLLIGAALSFVAERKERKASCRKALCIAAFACVFAGIAIARYAFYAVVA